jgi:hypothetical protein
MAGLVYTNPWRKFAISVAIVILFVYLTKGVPLESPQNDQNSSQQTNSRLLPVDDSGEDPFAVQWLDKKLKDLRLKPSSFKVSSKCIA